MIPRGVNVQEVRVTKGWLNSDQGGTKKVQNGNKEDPTNSQQTTNKWPKGD